MISSGFGSGLLLYVSSLLTRCITVSIRGAEADHTEKVCWAGDILMVPISCSST